MCYAVPGKIIKIEGDKATVSYGFAREQREARLLDDSFKQGDYVVVANKIVLDKVSEEEALEAIEAWKQAMKTQEE